MSFQNCKIVGVGINAESYHKQTAPRGASDFIVSPSSLKLFMECPSRFQAGYEPPESESKDWGSLLDCLVLTPESFEARYSVHPATYPADRKRKGDEPIEKAWNWNAAYCKDWREKQGEKQVISPNCRAECNAAAERLLADDTIASFHNASDKQVHVTGEWSDKTTGLVIPVQCLIDYVPKRDSEFQKVLGDLKTTRNAAQRAFAHWCYTAGYHIQAAFDLALYTAATKGDRTDWIFIIQENYSPFETGRRLLGQSFLEIGRQTYEHALGQYAKCLKTGIWRGYDPQDEFSLIDAEPYMEFAALEDAIENTQEEQTVSNDDIIP